MTTYISPYTPSLVLPQYKTTNYDISLEVALLQKKQKDFDTFLARINNLKSQAINITMINEDGIEKLKQYNDELDVLLSGDPGDLTDPAVQNKMASYFNKVAGDSDLKQLSKYSQHYLNQQETINKFKDSKDPKERQAYNAINEYVFVNGRGGLNEFIKAKDTTDWRNKMKAYTPYKDIDQKAKNLVSLMKEEMQVEQGPKYVKGPDGKMQHSGYMEYTEVRGRSPAKVKKLFESMLDADELQQFNINAEYSMLTASPENLYSSYNTFMTVESGKTKTQIEILQSQYDAHDPSKLDANATDDVKARWQQKRAELEESINFLKEKQTYQNQNKYDKASFENLDYDAKRGLMSRILVDNYINNMSEALAPQSSIHKLTMDPVYFKTLDYNLAVQKEQNLNVYRQNTLMLRQMDMQARAAREAAGGAIKPENIPSEGVFFQDTKELAPTYEAVLKLKSGYDESTADLVATIDQSKLKETFKNTEWVKKNANNYQVKLWEHYRVSNPDLESKTDEQILTGFKTFLGQVDNGDHNTNTRVLEIRNQYLDNKEVQKYLTDKVNYLNRQIENLAGVENTIAPGGNAKLKDFSTNKKNASGELIYRVPAVKNPDKNNPGDYKEMSWSEIKEEIKRGIDLTKANNIAARKARAAMEQGNPALSAGYTIINTVIDFLENLYSGSIDASHILQIYEGNLLNVNSPKDTKFLLTAAEAIKKEHAATKEISHQINNVLPGYFQPTQIAYESPTLIATQIGKISEAVRSMPIEQKGFFTKGKYVPMSLTQDNITAIYLPTTGTTGGFKLSEKGAKMLKETYPDLRFVDANGKSQEINPVVIYQFNTNPVRPPADQLYNIMLNDPNGSGKVVKQIAGKQVTISKSPLNSSEVFVTIEGLQGRYIPFQGDVRELFTSIEKILMATSPPPTPIIN